MTTEVIYTNTDTIFYNPPNPTLTVDDLTITSEPIYEDINLSWTPRSGAVNYVLYYLDNGSWVSFGTYTSTNITVQIPGADTFQVRTDDVYPSNTVTGTRAETPELRVVTTFDRYDGVLVTWDIPTAVDETVEVYRNGTFIESGNFSSYLAASSGNYSIRMYRGTPGDAVYGPISAAVAGSVLPPPADRTEPTAPAEFFLGQNRAGEMRMHICNPSVVPVLPADFTYDGVQYSSAVDFAVDFVGGSVDYGEETYFHSEMDYVYVVRGVKITNFTTSGSVRIWNLSNARDIRTDTSVSVAGLELNCHFLALVNKNTGTIESASPLLTKSVKYEGNATPIITYSQGKWGYGTDQAYYNSINGSPVGSIRTPTDVGEVRIYYLNLEVAGRELRYINNKFTSKTLPGGLVIGQNEIYVNDTEFLVGGNDFGDSMFLSWCGNGVTEHYILSNQQTSFF